MLARCGCQCGEFLAHRCVVRFFNCADRSHGRLVARRQTHCGRRRKGFNISATAAVARAATAHAGVVRLWRRCCRCPVRASTHSGGGRCAKQPRKGLWIDAYVRLVRTSVSCFCALCFAADWRCATMLWSLRTPGMGLGKRGDGMREPIVVKHQPGVMNRGGRASCKVACLTSGFAPKQRA